MHVEAVASEATLSARIESAGIPRWADATLAFLALALAAPVIVILGVAIKLSSRGPIFFQQARVGRHGQLFNLYKLRTMKLSNDGPQVTARDDARITSVGRFLRRTKLDELPTFWNVLRGDMALVGPRPEVPRYVQLDDPVWQALLAVRPGLTDPVTLSLRNEEELLAGVGSETERYYVEELQPAKLKGYVTYLAERTWRTDFKVLGKTLVAIVTG